MKLEKIIASCTALALTLGLAGCEKKRPNAQSEKQPAQQTEQILEYAQQRTFYPNSIIETRFNYDKGVLGIMGIATEAEAKIQKTGNTIMKASNGRLEDLGIEGEKSRYLILDADFYVNGEKKFRKEQFYKTHHGKVAREILDGRWQLDYPYQDWFGLPTVIVTDLGTGTKVAECGGIQIVGDGSFLVKETHYKQERPVFESIVRRHCGTGLIIEEQIRKGKMLRDFHPYELALGEWPMGGSSMFPGGFGGSGIGFR